MTGPVDLALREAEAFAASRVPRELADQMAIKVVRDGNAITISEARPPWNPDIAQTDWTNLQVAQLRLDASSGRWRLFYRDRAERWRPYEGVSPAATIGPLLAEIAADPTGIFWG